MNRSLRDLYGMETNNATTSTASKQQNPRPRSNPATRQLPTKQRKDATSHKGKRVKRSGVGGNEEAKKKRQCDTDKMSDDIDDPVHLTASPSYMTPPKRIRYSDLGGLENVIQDIKELVEYPLKHPEVYGWLGVEPPRGVLLHGPPGCGKTALAHAIAFECQVPFFKISAPEIISGMSGATKCRIMGFLG